MPSRSDLLLGQIAVEKGFISEKQLGECLKAQEKYEKSKTPKHLGLILLEKEFLDEEELDLALEIQRQKLNRKADNTDVKLKDLLIGQIAVNLKLVKRAEVDDCIREQAKIESLGIFLRLGEIMIKKGFLTQEQVDEILEYQRNLIDNFKKEAMSGEENGGAA